MRLVSLRREKDTDPCQQTLALVTTPFILSESMAKSLKMERDCLRAKDYGAGLYYATTVCSNWLVKFQVAMQFSILLT